VRGKPLAVAGVSDAYDAMLPTAKLSTNREGEARSKARDTSQYGYAKLRNIQTGMLGNLVP